LIESVYYTQGQGLLSQQRNNASYFYHYDGLGSTKALTDANQNIQSSTIYDAWGNILQSSGTITNPYLYVGELGYYGDGDAGMYLLTQRWYNPVIGRFVVRDPLKLREGPPVVFNHYLYAEDKPLGGIDPTGLQSCPIIHESFACSAQKPSYGPCNCLPWPLSSLCRWFIHWSYCEACKVDCRSWCTSLAIEYGGSFPQVACFKCCDRGYGRCMESKKDEFPLEGICWSPNWGPHQIVCNYNK
jgi:RHS repeat-associated protein